MSLNNTPTKFSTKLLEAGTIILGVLIKYLPIPHKTGLIKIGNPNSKSPVFVSGNYFQTVKRIIKNLQGFDCYLLVVDSAGVNVWCAAGAGDFNEHKIADTVNVVKLHELVEHRKLIVPQLAAVGIDVKKLKEECGFQVTWGPASLFDLAKFLKQDLQCSAQMRLASYTFLDRLYQAIGLLSVYFNPLKYYLIFILIFGTKYNTFVIPAMVITFLVILTTVFSDYLPCKWPTNNLILLNIPVLFLIWAYTDYAELSLAMSAYYIICFFVLLFLICADTLGSTVWYKTTIGHWLKTFNCRSLFQPKITEACSGCNICFQVCPKGVFEKTEKGMVVHYEKECCECLACVKQCFKGAIVNLHGKVYKHDIKSLSEEQLQKIMR